MSPSVRGGRLRLGPVLLVLMATVAWSIAAVPSAHAAAPTICPDRLAIARSSVSLQLPVCANRPLDQASTSVSRLIIVIHGDSRNAADHLRYVERAAESSGVEDALIVAPQFLTAEDVLAAGLARDTLYWGSDEWKRGSASARSPLRRAMSVPAFGVIDDLVTRLADPTRYPNLRSVVIAGHSAGGQFAQRYAASNRVGPTLAQRSLSLRFVVANPSSYLYLDARRYDATEEAMRELTSAERAACPRFDTYRHGLLGPGPYGSTLDGAAVRGAYAAQTVTYLLGSLDTDPNDPDLDASCAGRWQGRHRLERGQLFQRSLQLIFGTGIDDTHRFDIVPDVGHEASRIYRSTAGMRALFD
jgi:hypothetical protein